jgi:hypothetical protein
MGDLQLLVGINPNTTGVQLMVPVEPLGCLQTKQNKCINKFTTTYDF